MADSHASCRARARARRSCCCRTAIKQLTAHWTLVSPLRWAAGTANVGVAATRCMRRRRRRASTHAHMQNVARKEASEISKQSISHACACPAGNSTVPIDKQPNGENTSAKAHMRPRQSTGKFSHRFPRKEDEDEPETAQAMLGRHCSLSFSPSLFSHVFAVENSTYVLNVRNI